ncbi:MAG: S8/S53 family peptidase [Myxococcota bacterium]
MKRLARIAAALLPLLYAEGAFAQTTTAPNRACRNDAYFVDVPTWAVPPWSSAATFATQLEGALNHAVQQDWFCGTDGITCLGRGIGLALRATVSPVLTARSVSSEPWRNDGDRRFFRVGFYDNTDPRTTLSVRPSRVCAAVSQIRASALSVAPGAALLVGRDCEATAQLSPVEAQPTAEMLNWHLTRMGATPPPTRSESLDVVLIDSGVDPLARTGLRIATTQHWAFGSYHPHGSAMASFIRQIAPNVALHDYHVLSSDGHTPTRPLAQAIDRALFDLKTARPMILNLSLGWTPVYSTYSTIVDIGTCSSWEDPSGEVIRYLLAGAATNDRATVVAAAGNDPSTGKPFTGSLTPPTGAAIPPACAKLESKVDWFYPARWNYQPTCFRAGGAQYAAVIGVSALNDRELESAVAIPGTTSRLAAPGDHVYAQIPGVPSNSSRVCPATVGVRGVESPQVFSGSSVAAALVTGALARAQEANLAAGHSALSSQQLRSLAYLTGDPTCGAAWDNSSGYRLNVERLDAALANGACVSGLLGCTAQTPWECAAQITACNLPHPLQCPRAAPTPVGWPSAPGNACDAQVVTATTVTGSTCTGNACPYMSPPNRVLSGSSGPQPTSPGCLDCLVQCSHYQWILSAQLNSSYPAGTDLSNPVLVVNNNGLKRYVNLLNFTDAAAWHPGAFVQVILPENALGPLTTCPTVTGELVLKITINKVSGTDYSPLRVKAL